ncbi:unnamed protein product, partial [Prorocentrum cordatum]
RETAALAHDAARWQATGAAELSGENGLEARRQLKIEHERTGNRRAARPQFILSPQDKRAKDRESGIEVSQSLTAREAIVAEQADQTGAPDGRVFAASAARDGAANVGGPAPIDSGSDGHLCRRKFAPEAPVNGAVGAPRILGVQQRPQPVAGLRGAEITTQEVIKATAGFLVADAIDDLPSMGKLLRYGPRFNLSLEDGPYLTKGHRGAQLELERNSPRPLIASAGPAGAGRRRGAAGQPAKAPALAADSPASALRMRSRELRAPIYGAKTGLRERPIAAEAAHRRAAAEAGHRLDVKEQPGTKHDPVEASQPPAPKTPSAEEE